MTTHTIDVQDMAVQIPALLAEVEAGEEIVITRAEQPIARLVPCKPEKPERQLGEAKGLVEIADDFDDLPDDFMEHFS